MFHFRARLKINIEDQAELTSRKHLFSLGGMSTPLSSPLIPAKYLVDKPPEVFGFELASRFGDRSAVSSFEVVEVFFLRL